MSMQRVGSISDSLPQEVELVNVNVIEGCCGSVVAGPLTESDAEDLAAAFKVLSDPIRLRML